MFLFLQNQLSQRGGAHDRSVHFHSLGIDLRLFEVSGKGPVIWGPAFNEQWKKLVAWPQVSSRFPSKMQAKSGFAVEMLLSLAANARSGTLLPQWRNICFYCHCPFPWRCSVVKQEKPCSNEPIFMKTWQNVWFCQQKLEIGNCWFSKILAETQLIRCGLHPHFLVGDSCSRVRARNRASDSRWDLRQVIQLHCASVSLSIKKWWQLGMWLIISFGNWWTPNTCCFFLSESERRTWCPRTWQWCAAYL